MFGVVILYCMDKETRKEEIVSHISPGCNLISFKKTLLKEHGIDLSTAKLRKILITGGCFSTKRSREVARLYEKLGSISLVAKELGLTTELVTMYLPYKKVVYDLEEKSGNAKRVERWRNKQRQL